MHIFSFKLNCISRQHFEWPSKAIIRIFWIFWFFPIPKQPSKLLIQWANQRFFPEWKIHYLFTTLCWALIRIEAVVFVPITEKNSLIIAWVRLISMEMIDVSWRTVIILRISNLAMGHKLCWNNYLASHTTHR